ncbi:hypothetical protein [Campylobacter troglodytis]|uniref:hypothetical protein n=1 Tax=Campylobacter troglodytis TaxID=654363 RepID=UPI00115AC5D5|nr:hypothetical protein [Campylobacter troglodytis]TQR60901.1 hypothetical protein DMC01_03515 [Campylobacter troglodytis]
MSLPKSHKCNCEFFCFVLLQLRSKRAFTKHNLAKFKGIKKEQFYASYKRNSIYIQDENSRSSFA